MGCRGTVFHPELIELMKAVLEDATATLPEAKRTSTMKAEIASRILACAAKGEHDPITLKMAALSAVDERTDQSHGSRQSDQSSKENPRSDNAKNGLP